MEETPQRKDYQERNSELYDMYRKESLESIRSNTEAYDKGIFFVASIFLAASMALVRLEGPEQTFAMKVCMSFAWLSLILAIGCTLISFVLGNRALKEHIQRLEKMYFGGDPEALNAENPFEKRRKLFGDIGGISLIVSTILIVSYALMSIS